MRCLSLKLWYCCSLIVCVLGGRPALAQPSDYVCETDIVTRFGDAGISMFTIRDQLAYCSTSSPVKELRVYDLANLNDIRLLGSLELNISGFDIEGDYLYAMTASSGLKVIDISDATNPHIVGSIATAATNGDVRVSGSTAVCISGTKFIHIVDVSNPAAPRLLHFTYNSIDYISGFEIVDSTLYIANRDRPISIYEVGSTGLLTKYGEFGFLSGEGNLRIDGDLLRFRDSGVNTSALQTWDITSRVHPTLNSEYATDGWIYGYDFDGSNATVGVSNYGLKYFDIDLFGIYLQTGNTDSVSAFGPIEYYGDYICKTDGGGIVIVDPRGQNSYPIASRFSYADNSYDFMDIEMAGSLLLGASQGQDHDGLVVSDIFGGDSPVYLGGYSLTSGATEIKYADHRAIIRDVDDRLWLFDLSDITNPTFVEIYQVRANSDFAIAGDNFYLVIDFDQDVQIYRIQSGVPALASSFGGVGDYPSSIAVAGNYVYIHYGNIGEMHIVDVTTPENPVRVSVLSVAFESEKSVVSDGFYYSMDRDEITIVDVRDPNSPSVVAVVDAGSMVRDFAVGASKLAICASMKSLLVYDIANPSQPRFVHSRQYPTLTGATQFETVELSEDESTAIVSTYDELLLIDIATGCEIPCPPDTNHDGILSPADFTAWIAAFNAQAPECDQNSDGSCSPADFTAWIANYNAGCP